MKSSPSSLLEKPPEPGGRVADEESERRLAELRREARERGTVSAPGVRPAGAPFPQATPETGYYGVPLLKKPVWTWEVPLYFFVGGAAGAAAVVAAVAETIGNNARLARDARWMAAAGAPMSAALLTSDLGRPERFIFMLRIFKPQSPMSIGSWTLAAFTATTAGAAFAGAVSGRLDVAPVRFVANTSGTLAALFGTVMATYTGVLIGATAIPVWNENVRLLPLHFGASGVASAAALLELLGHDDVSLNDMAMAAAAVETVVGAVLESQDLRSLRPLKQGASGWIVRAGGVLSGPVPLVCRAFGRRFPKWRRVAALSALVGSLLTRFGWVAAGRASAADAGLALADRISPPTTSQLPNSTPA